MKNLKIRILLIVFLLITIICTISNASYNDVTMSVVEEPICTINFGSNSSFEKRLYSKNLNDKEVTLQLKVTNGETSTKPTGEIMLVIDNSKSMLDPAIADKSRQDLVIDSAKVLITNLLEDNTKLKIGAVSFSTKSLSEEAIAEDARLVSELTNNTENLLSSISNIQYDGPKTNLDAGITLAKQYFTNDTDKAHKYVIVLTDGIPNVAINDANYYEDTVISKTKENLQSLSNIADNVIVMLTGITDGNAFPTYMPSYSGTRLTNDEIIEEVFGTESNPTIGKFYYITDDKIEETIKSNIYNDLLPTSQSFKNISIVDYFPKEIVENFDFAYVQSANIGNISAEIDKSNNSITWTIPELKSGETAVVQYKLKLIENYNASIVDKILDTNTKVDLTYTDNSGKINSKTSDVTPKIKLTEPLPAILPKAGKTILFGIISLVLIVAIILGVRYFNINHKMK